MRIVEIRWRDNASAHGWIDVLAKPLEITSVGYLVDEQPDCYVLVDGKVIDAERGTLQWGGSVAILKVCVLKFRDLGEGEFPEGEQLPMVVG